MRKYYKEIQQTGQEVTIGTLAAACAKLLRDDKADFFRSLKRELRSSNFGDRFDAVRILVEMDSKETIPLLNVALRDSDSDVSLIAAKALIRLKHGRIGHLTVKRFEKQLLEFAQLADITKFEVLGARFCNIFPERAISIWLNTSLNDTQRALIAVYLHWKKHPVPLRIWQKVIGLMKDPKRRALVKGFSSVNRRCRNVSESGRETQTADL